MSGREAAETALEQIAWWQARGVEPAEAWRALSPDFGFESEWIIIYRWMVRWLVHHDVQIDSGGACHIMDVERGPARES